MTDNLELTESARHTNTAKTSNINHAALLTVDGGEAADALLNSSTSGTLLHPKVYLDLPLNISRPSSPGTLSNLSTNEWHSLQGNPKGFPGGKPAWRQRFDAFWVRNLGVFYILVGNLFGTAMNVLVRILEVEGNKGKGIHPFQVLFARMAITFVLATTYMVWAKTPHFPLGMPEVRWLLLARGFGGLFGVFGMYYSLMYLPLADATVITFLAPGLSCWACSFLINEPFTFVEKIGTLVSLVGVLFIARPASLLAAFTGQEGAVTAAPGDASVHGGGNSTVHAHDSTDFSHVTSAERVGAVGVALIGVLGAVSAYTTLRWIGKRAHPLISVNYLSGWCTLVSLVMQLALPSVGFLLPADSKDWGLLFLLGICGFIMQFLLASALAYEKSSRATNMLYTSMLFALASDKIFFDSTPGLSSIAGSVLILGAALVMAVQKSQPPAQKDGPTSIPVADEERGLMGDVEGLSHSVEAVPLQEVK